MNDVVDIPPDVDASDVERWLQGTCFHAEHPDLGSVLVNYVYVQRVTTATAGEYSYRVGVDGGVGVGSFWTSPQSISLAWPKLGAATFDEIRCAAYLERLPARQWRRGFAAQCIELTFPERDFVVSSVGILPAAAHMTKLKYAKYLFSPSYATAWAAANSIRDGSMLSVAIGKHSILAGTVVEDELSFWYRGKNMGYLDASEWAFSPLPRCQLSRERISKILGGVSWQ